MRYKIVMTDQPCHYCEDMIEKLNKEYDKLYRILQLQEKITKQQNFVHCLNQVNIYRKYLDEMVEYCIEEGDTDNLCDYRITGSNLLTYIKDKSFIITHGDLIMY
tara:strand:+ start:796 stop:1110 length:315 start_codon:yes stop_codon:yes gene_type:complete